MVKSRGQYCGDVEIDYPNPNDIDRSLTEAVTDKIQKYRTNYNNNPHNTVSFMPVIASTSDILHSEFISDSSTYTARLSLRCLNHVSVSF